MLKYLELGGLKSIWLYSHASLLKRGAPPSEPRSGTKAGKTKQLHRSQTPPPEDIRAGAGKAELEMELAYSDVVRKCLRTLDFLVM